MEYRILTYDQLDKDLLYDILALRSATFVVEQHDIYLDPDGKDRDCYHLVCTDGGRLVGCMRILKRGQTFHDAVTFGRIIAADRGKGIGSEMIRRAIAFVEDELHEDTIRMKAQMHLTGYYERFGFEAYGEPYPDVSIPHINMVRHRPASE